MKLSLIAGLILALGVFFLANDDSEAMALCQTTHSFDVCHSSIDQ